jgi:hypothetical protein
MAAEFPLKIETENAVAPSRRSRCKEDDGGELGGRKREGGGAVYVWQQHRDAAILRKRAKIEE